MTPSINLLHPDFRANPYPVYAELRRGPVCRVEPGDIWAVSRYDDVQLVLRNPEIFSSGGFQAMLKPAWLPHNPLGDSILAMDPPGHTAKRALLSSAFNARSIARMAPLAQAIAGELTDSLPAGGEVDFVAAFAAQFPARIIGEILGLDPSLHSEFKRWGEDLAAITPAEPSEELAASIRETVADMERYLQEVLDARRRAPGDDIVSDLIRAKIDGESLTNAEIMAFLFLLLPAGFETTTGLFSNSILGFVERPDDLARLRADPALIPAFIEETLRWNPPVHSVLRVTTRNVDFQGVTVPRGSMVVALLASANRDEAQFPDPDRFDMHRVSQGGVAFGQGLHFCLGVSLARMEGRIGLAALLSRFKGFERPPGDISWNRALTVRSPTALPVRCIPA